jgi:hypothetical protein
MFDRHSEEVWQTLRDKTSCGPTCGNSMAWGGDMHGRGALVVLRAVDGSTAVNYSNTIVIFSGT